MLYQDPIDTIFTDQTDKDLMYARRRLRSGKRYLQAGRKAAAITALYDSILFGMYHYILNHEDCTKLVERLKMWEATDLFQELARMGVFGDPLEFNRFSLIAERVLWEESYPFDAEAVLAEVETMLTRLGVMPLKEAASLTRMQDL